MTAVHRALCVSAVNVFSVIFGVETTVMMYGRQDVIWLRLSQRTMLIAFCAPFVFCRSLLLFVFRFALRPLRLRGEWIFGDFR